MGSASVASFCERGTGSAARVPSWITCDARPSRHEGHYGEIVGKGGTRDTQRRWAGQLHSRRHVEAAAARAYYAMFYVAEALLYERGLSFRKHAGVHGAFGQHFAKSGVLDAKIPPVAHRRLQ
ncbi:MAG: HEPN domain-containing protein [Gammaproteobacteria bacterium]